MITCEAWKLEVQIMRRMLERIGLKPELDILPYAEYLRKAYLPILDKPPEKQDWDIAIGHTSDWFGHTGAAFLP